MKSVSFQNPSRIPSSSLAGSAVGLLLLLLMLSPSASQARPNIRLAFFTFYTNAVGSRLDSVPSKAGHCGVCHYDFNGGGTRNAYGAALENYATTNGCALTQEACRNNAVRAMRSVDMDADGYTTDTEVTNTTSFSNTPTFPGLKTTTSVVNVALADIAGYLTPVVGGDTTPPFVQVLTPNGGQTNVANRPTNITWAASDVSGIASVDIYLSLDNGSIYQQIARGLANSGTYSWVPSDRPTAAARIKVVAKDTYGNTRQRRQRRGVHHRLTRFHQRSRRRQHAPRFRHARHPTLRARS